MAGLYIHVPFCRQRCTYCDFYFVAGQRDHSAFVAALCRELRQVARRGFSEPVSTIYIGGGTPSQLTSQDIARILRGLRKAYDAAAAEEVTIELNPEDVTAPYLQALKKLGISRVSVGIQSFFDDELTFMNRSHDARQAHDALALVAGAGFRSYTVDLIFGLPGQTEDRWAQNLDRLRAFDAPHVSTYSLTIEPKTPLQKQVARGLVSPLPDQAMATLYQMAMDTLSSHGYEHYEISSFAQPGHRAQHNSRYWSHANYLGFGPSAHSFWWQRTGGAARWRNVRSLRQYVALIRGGQSDAVCEDHEILSLPALGLERIMLALRTAEGVDLLVLKETYDMDLLATKGKTIARLTQAGLVTTDARSLRLTDRGKHICDRVTASLLP